MSNNNVDFSDWFASHARHEQEMRHLGEIDAQNKEHHSEMMKLINDHKTLIAGYKKNRNGYDKLEARYDTLIDIIREHLPEMSISRDEVNARMDAAENSAKLTYPE